MSLHRRLYQASSVPFIAVIVFLLSTTYFSLADSQTATTNDAQLDLVQKWMTDNVNNTMDRLYQFLSIPSVSANRALASQVHQAADWLVTDLKIAGLENVQLLPSPLHPAVYADWLHAPDTAPTILIYAHYDVQPEDPVSLWTSPPFTPTVRDGRLYARGASDDKGHLYVVATVLRAFLTVSGNLPVNVKILFEGEEEIGSPNFPEIVKTHADLLRADFAFSADGTQLSETMPGICLGLRGVVALDVSVRVANVDLHSGSYGGGVQNAVHALVNLLDALRHKDSGRIAVDSFYDDVVPLSQSERDDIAAFPLSDQVELTQYGVNESVGESGFSFYERAWARPSLEIVGIKGGFQGDGIKTVLPCEASAKLSSRIVPNQSAEKVISLLKSFILKTASTIPGIEVSVQRIEGSGEPFVTKKTGTGNAAAAKVLKDIYGRDPAFFRLGGSIPAFMTLQQILSVDTTMFAFALSSENWHAPDEFTRLSSLRRGERAYAMLLVELAKLSRQRHESGDADEKQDEL